MIQTLLDAIHRQQIEQYEDEKVYELDCRNPKAEDSDVLLVTLAAEFLGLQKTIELALACHAKVVSQMCIRDRVHIQLELPELLIWLRR